MFKRLFTLVLTVALVFPAFLDGTAVRANKHEDTMARLESTIQQQYRPQAKKLDRSGADEAVQKQFLRNARTAENIYAKQGDALTAVVYNANLYEYALVKGLTAAIDRMQLTNQTEMFVKGSVGWYDHRLSYTYRDYTEIRDQALEAGDLYGGTLATSPTKGISLATDNYDAVLMLIGGSVYSTFDIKRTKVTATEMTYDVTAVVYDEFNFDGDYSAAEKKGYDTSRAKILTILGRLLGYKSFHWETTANFQVTVPYECDHESGAYHWTYANKEMTNHVEGEFSANPVEKIVELQANGKEYSPYFEMERGAILRHDRPWVVEFTNKGSTVVSLNPTPKVTSGLPYFIRTQTTRTAFDGTKSYEYYAFIGEYTTQKLTPEEIIIMQATGKTGVFYRYRGFDYSSVYNSKRVQTYRFENRVEADGSNMVYLIIDGEELGPMTDHYMSNKVIKTEKQGSNDTRLNGLDLFINYIGNQSYRQGTGLKSVTIWENGEGVGTQSSMRTVVTEPTCAEQGYTTHYCIDCGYSYRTDYVPALPHTEVADPAVEPTCTASGLTAGTHCAVCNTVLTAQSNVAALGHVEKLRMDESGHWYACERENCDMIAGQDVHRYDAGSCGENAKCNVCGYEGGEGCHIPGKWKVKKKATCVEPGLRTATCTACEGKLEEEIEPHGQAVVEIPEQPATCTKNGKTAKLSCSECGKIVQRQKTIKKGHQMTVLCRDESGHWYACENCDAIGKASAHKYDVDSCEETACCEECGYEKTAGEHIPGKWKVTKKAACVKEGLRTATCTVCKEKLKEVIEPHGEAVVEIPEQPATCTENGKTAKLSCSECGKTVQNQKTIRKGHLLTELCFDESRHWYECEQEECDAAGKASTHRYKNGVCKVCNYEKE